MTMRMEMTSLHSTCSSTRWRRRNSSHTVSAGYVTAAVFVMGVSAWYPAQGRHIELARRSYRGRGPPSGWPRRCPVVKSWATRSRLLGHPQPADETGREIEGDVGGPNPPPPPSHRDRLFRNQEARETHFAVHIPWAMGLIGTRLARYPRSPGINELEQRAEGAVSARASSPRGRAADDPGGENPRGGRPEPRRDGHFRGTFRRPGLLRCC